MKRGVKGKDICKKEVTKRVEKHIKKGDEHDKKLGKGRKVKE